MNKIGVMIGTYLFETIEEAHAALRQYGYLEGNSETFLVELPEKPFTNLLIRTRRRYPIFNDNLLKKFQENIEKEIS